MFIKRTNPIRTDMDLSKLRSITILSAWFY